MRGDGYPWLYYQISDRPNEGQLQGGNYSVDDLPDIVSQCLWMYQGVCYPGDSIRNDIINIPHALVQLKEGDKLINVATNSEYEIVDIIGEFRDLHYAKPPIEGIPESIKIPPRIWARGGFLHPSELVGATVQIRRLDAQDDQIDIDYDKGHFLSLPASALVKCRLVEAEQADLGEGKGEEDRNADIRSGYDIEVQVTKEGPNEGAEFFGDTTSPTPRRRKATRTNQQQVDFTKVPEVYTMTEDAWVDFYLKGPSGRETGWMVQWFKTFMHRYRPVIRRIGYKEILPVGRFGGKDASLRTPEAGSGVRVRYGVRSEVIYASTPWKLRAIETEVESKKPDDETPESIVVGDLKD